MSVGDFSKLNSNGLCFTDISYKLPTIRSENVRKFFKIDVSDEYKEFNSVLRTYHDKEMTSLKSFIIFSNVYDIEKFQEILIDNINTDLYDLLIPEPIIHNSYGPAITYYNRDGTLYQYIWAFNGENYTKQVNEWFKENKFKTWKQMSEDDFNRMWMEIL